MIDTVEKSIEESDIMINGVEESIEESDIMYQDDLVCILRPDIKKGIIIYSEYKQLPKMDNVCISGLKTEKQLHTEGVDINKKIYHPYIVFKAPYYSQSIDYSTIETEIASSFGEKEIKIEEKHRVFIRVDPNKTFVFTNIMNASPLTPYFHITDGHLISDSELSETHSKYIMTKDDVRFEDLNRSYYYTELNKTKKTLSEYLTIIKENKMSTAVPNIYNLYSSKKVVMNKKNVSYPFSVLPIERNSEIHVSMPLLTPDYFVLCT